MTIGAYFEDSGKDGLFAIGGCFAPIRVWREWEQEWRALLKQKPRLGYFRSADALALDGQFGTFSSPERDARVRLLAQTLQRHSLYGAYAFIHVKHLTEFFDTEYAPISRYPHYVCSLFLMQYLNMHFGDARPVPGRVDYIFDRQTNVQDSMIWVSDAFAEVDRQLHPFVGKVRFEDKTRFLPLQAADMYVSWARRKVSGGKGDLISDQILQTIPQFAYEIDRDWLARNASGVRSILER